MPHIGRTITVRRIRLGRHVLSSPDEMRDVRFRPPVRLRVRKDGGWLVADDEVLHIHLAAEDLKALRKEAEEELRLLLEEYAEGDEMMMTDGARRLRNELLKRIGK